MCQISPAGQKNYLQAIINFIEFVKAFVDPNDYGIENFLQKILTLKSMFDLPRQGNQRRIQEGYRAEVFNASVNPKAPDFGFTMIFTGKVLHDLKVKIIKLIVDGAKNDVLAYYGLTIMRICVSTIVLKCCQRPCVASNLTLQEYCDQRKNNQIFVKDHKTKASRPAYFPFVIEDKFWFQQYYKLIRPTW